MLELNDANFDTILNDASGVFVVDFYTTWCGPCRVQIPALQFVESQGVNVAKVDTDANPQVAAQFNISSIPTILIMKNGQEVKRFVGVQKDTTLLQAVNAVS